MTAENKDKQNTNGQDTAAIIRAALRGRSDSELAPEDIPAFAQNYRNGMNHYRRRGQQFLAEGITGRPPRSLGEPSPNQ